MPLPESFEGERWTPKIARHIFPWLIWAAKNRHTVTYGGLDEEIVRRKVHHHVIEVVYGHPAGAIGDAMYEIGEELGFVVPPLNALIIGQTSKVPGDGCEGYITSFLGRRIRWDDLSNADKQVIAEEVQNRVFDFQAWDAVQDYVRDQWGDFPELRPFRWNLKTPPSFTFPMPTPTGITVKSSKFARPPKSSVMGLEGGGEGEAHRLMKEYIADNPAAVGLPANAEPEPEYPFWSGDRADILFSYRAGQTVIEVKPATSPDEDIYRGIHQCIKYKALLRAEQILCGRIPNGAVKLVVGRVVPASVAEDAHRLGVPLIEGFKAE